MGSFWLLDVMGRGVGFGCMISWRRVLSVGQREVRRRLLRCRGRYCLKLLSLCNGFIYVVISVLV